jgi:fructokinase
MPFTLVGVGELLWDELPSGRVAGGAPANFAHHAAQLGADARLVSRVGTDQAGDDILKVVADHGLTTECVERDPTAPTGRVTVAGEPPRYTIHEGVAWDRIEGTESTRRAVATADAVCFCALAQRAEPSRTTIRELLRAVKPGCLRVFDVNRREPFYSKQLLDESFLLTDVLKVNDSELVHLTGLFGLPIAEPEAMAELAARYGFKAVACTRAEKGSAILRGGEWSEGPAVPTTVVDTIGAGDSFTAAMTLGLLAGWPLDVVNRRAAEVAAFVCAQRGGMPRLPDHLREPFLGIR